ncbi:Winged helix-turn-helix DNA-binding domain [Cinara cedri]|uniref:Winged helix-turn-helix DNA-binding domain n=1 Tax=Cinara cedri TaxID=506608 RepID=A0A5E4N1F5_9HEMI|nr:Winged helix-turn-helix DNA-binding domain [Cinara cedri]
MQQKIIRDRDLEIENISGYSSVSLGVIASDYIHVSDDDVFGLYFNKAKNQRFLIGNVNMSFKGDDIILCFKASLPKKVIRGSGFNNFLNNKFMPEMHWPSHNNLGPFTKSKKPINKLVEAVMEHDFYYEKHKDTKSRHKADLILENKARWKNPETSLEKKGLRLELKFEQIKHDGIFPFLFAVIGAANALAGFPNKQIRDTVKKKKKKGLILEMEVATVVDFILKFNDDVDWELILIEQHLSENCIKEIKDEIDWELISTWQTLSDDFILEFKDDVD